MPTRRQFLASLVVALLPLVATRSGLSPFHARGRRCVNWDSPYRETWLALRLCWQDLDSLSDATYQGPTEGEQRRLVARHRLLLEELVSAREIDRPVAELLQDAFERVSHHFWRLSGPMSCYLILDSAYMDSLDDLVGRRELLMDVSGGQDIDPETLLLAQQAIESDIAFWQGVRVLSEADPPTPLQDMAQYMLDRLYYVDAPFSSEVEQAACILVDLMSGGNP